MYFNKFFISASFLFSFVLVMSCEVHATEWQSTPRGTKFSHLEKNFSVLVIPASNESGDFLFQLALSFKYNPEQSLPSRQLIVDIRRSGLKEMPEIKTPLMDGSIGYTYTFTGDPFQQASILVDVLVHVQDLIGLPLPLINKVDTQDKLMTYLQAYTKNPTAGGGRRRLIFRPDSSFSSATRPAVRGKRGREDDMEMAEEVQPRFPSLNRNLSLDLDNDSEMAEEVQRNFPSFKRKRTLDLDNDSDVNSSSSIKQIPMIDLPADSKEDIQLILPSLSLRTAQDTTSASQSSQGLSESKSPSSVNELNEVPQLTKIVRTQKSFNLWGLSQALGPSHFQFPAPISKEDEEEVKENLPTGIIYNDTDSENDSDSSSDSEELVLRSR